MWKVLSRLGAGRNCVSQELSVVLQFSSSAAALLYCLLTACAFLFVCVMWCVFRHRAVSQLVDAAEEDQGWELDAADGGADELCNCRFSLAYGGKILLNNATLRLLRGNRYGLCGGNGVGKSTLMKAISRGQLDGFPPGDELKTVYVEHDIQVSEGDSRQHGGGPTRGGCRRSLLE